jgi:dTDP-4-amino-4,6-dideoxygalactose transaminase
MTTVPFLQPTFPAPADIAEDFAAISVRGIFTNGGPVETELARQLAAWIGNDASVSCLSSATAGLELALQVLIEPRKSRVLVPSFTFAAGALAIRRCGFVPIFIDVDLTTWQPSIADAKAVIDANSDIGGILLTSTFGVANPDIGQWEALASQNQLPLIIDSAAGFGSAYSWGEPLGSRGDCEIFSFHATKMLAIGEGGAIASRRDDVIDSINQLKNFGFDTQRESTLMGTNAKISEFAAAIGVQQLRVLPARIKARQRILRQYQTVLAPLGFMFQPGSEHCAPAFVSALLPSRSYRDAVVDTLTKGEIGCRTYYNPPLHRHRIFADTSPRELPATEQFASSIISLPISDTLGVDVIDRVATAAQAAAHV